MKTACESCDSKVVQSGVYAQAVFEWNCPAPSAAVSASCASAQEKDVVSALGKHGFQVFLGVT